MHLSRCAGLKDSASAVEASHRINASSYIGLEIDIETVHLHPVAATIFGGLMSATLLDAFLTLVLFLILGRKPLERLAEPRVGALTPAEAYRLQPQGD